MPKYLEKVPIRHDHFRAGVPTGFSCARLPLRTFGEMRGDARLRAALKRAVNRDVAPQTLIDAIRGQIRG